MVGYDFRATANYNHSFGESHITNLFLGTETNSIDRNKTFFNGWGMQYTMGAIPFYTYQFFKKSIEEGTDYYSVNDTRARNVAFFANGTYSFQGKYTLNGTIRYEGTSNWVKHVNQDGCQHGILPQRGTFMKNRSSRLWNRYSHTLH